MLIRRLTPADAPAYRSLLLQAYRLHPDAFTSSWVERTRLPDRWWHARLADLPAVGETVLGAWRDSRLLGTVGLRAELGERTRHKADLFALGVALAAQGQGLGGQLMQAVLAEAASRVGLQQLRLSVSAGNTAALRCYRRAGFSVHGREPRAVQSATPAPTATGWGAPAYVDKLLMGLSLPPSQAHWQPEEGELAEAHLTQAPCPHGGQPVTWLTLRLSAAGVWRQWPPAAALPGQLNGLCLALMAPTPCPNPAQLAKLRGRLREVRLHHDSLLPQGAARWPLPPPLAWCAEPDHPASGATAWHLSLQTAQGESLALRAQALRLDWPAGARWHESWAC